MNEMEISTLQAERDALQRKVDELLMRVSQAEASEQKAVVESHLRVGAIAAGGRPEAVDDLVARALRSGQWKLGTKGQVIYYQDDKPSVRMDGEYAKPVDYFKTLRSEVPSYFADAQTTAQNGAASDPNPWSAAGWNLTKQGRILQNNGVDEARRMAAEAGSSLNATQPPKTHPPK